MSAEVVRVTRDEDPMPQAHREWLVTNGLGGFASATLSGEITRRYHGFLIAALHQAGLATLTHTPSPMGFLNEICGRPEREKPFVLLVAGYPAEGCRVPVAGGRKKPLDRIVSWL